LPEVACKVLLRDRRIAAQRLEERALAVELLQQVALEVRPARHLDDLEEPREAGVVVVGRLAAQEVRDALVEVLEAKQRSHPFVEGIFVGDHGPRPGLAAIVGQ